FGKQVATQLVAAGAKVALLGRTRDKLDALAARLSPAALPVVADVADPDQVRAAFDRIDETFGGLNILINNAAVYIPFRIEHASDEALDRILRTNLMGPMYCIREAVPRMKHGGGDTLNISSESTRNPYPFLTVYSSAKGCLIHLFLGMRLDQQL